MTTSELWVSANDRFKARAGDWMASGVIAAVLMHAGLFAFFPDLNAADINFTGVASEVIELPPEVTIPPPPDEIARPATPRPSESLIDDDIAMPKTDWGSNPVEGLGPPPAGQRPSDVPVWIQRDVDPRLTNAREIEGVLQQRYPSVLREAGIGGTVTLYVFVNSEGMPEKSQVKESSGYPPLDAAAAEVVDRMKFSPAMNRDRPVGVWVLQKVEFSSR